MLVREYEYRCLRKLEKDITFPGAGVIGVGSLKLGSGN